MTNPNSPAPGGFLDSNAAGVCTVLLTLLGWSSIPLFLRHFTGLIDGWTANGWRYLFSALLWAPVLLIPLLRSRSQPFPAFIWSRALVPSLFNALGQAAFGLAPYYVEPGLMTFSLRLQIVFVTLGAALLFASERRVIRKPWFLVGLAACFLGTMGTLVLKPGGLGGGTALGIALSIGSGLFYAGYALSVRHYMKAYSPLTAFAVISQYTAVLLLPPMLIMGEDHGATVFSLSAGQFGLLVLSSVIGIGLGHTLYYFSIARIGVAVSAGVIQLQPFVVSVASYFLFSERLTGPQWLSGGVAIAGAAVMLAVQHVVSRSPADPAAPPAPPKT